MTLQIMEGATRGYITEGDMYSNGKQIRSVESIGMMTIEYKKVVNGEIQSKSYKCKPETFEVWAKWKVEKR